jgi:hypothetical protein
VTGLRTHLGALLAASLSLVVFLVLLTGQASATDLGEFQSPSWTSLPTASPYNTTPNCPVSVGDPICNVPESEWPPPDPANPEWEQIKNPDGSWDTDHTGYINSAYWPAEKRPDIETYAVQKYGYNYQNCSSLLPHYCFLLDAETVGYSVTHTPVVGDLWFSPGECLLWAYSTAEHEAPSCNPASNTDWYIGYVEQVFPDGSFIQSWGGSDTPADSGIELTLFSGAMNQDTDFVPVLPVGSPPPGGWQPNDVQLIVTPTSTGATFAVSSPAPDPVLTITGPSDLTPPLDANGDAIVTLTAGQWTACAASGGSSSVYNAASDCTTFTIPNSVPAGAASGSSGGVTVAPLASASWRVHRVSGHVSVTATFTPSRATPAITARAGRRTVHFRPTDQRTGQVTLVATLPPARWTLTLSLSSPTGYSGPKPTHLTIVVKHALG